MKRSIPCVLVAAQMLATGCSSPAPSNEIGQVTDTTGVQVPLAVTADNFRRAETDMYLAGTLKTGTLGAFDHQRALAPIDAQTVVRTNRDTYYSSAVFDLDAGPVTISLPDAGSRYMSLFLLDQDHYTVLVDHAPSTNTLTRAQVGTRYLFAIVRTFGDPTDTTDIRKVHAIQDAIRVEQAGGPGSFEIPDWDAASRDHLRDSLKVLGAQLVGMAGAFGTREEVDADKHLIGTAIGWGGLPESEAMYDLVTPEVNDGKTIHRLHVAEVPVDGFWSVTVYNADGFMERNKQEAYSINSVTATPNAEGSFDIRFGGCDGKVKNCLPIMPGWNYAVRMYRPRPELLNGSWSFPKAEVR